MSQRLDPRSRPAAAAAPSGGDAEGGDAGGRRGARREVPWAAALAWALGAVALFGVYLELAGTWPTDSDGAGNALQACDMLHGNLLLHGWALSDVSFYTTELPQYMLVELVRGLNQGDVHVAAAMTYTLVVLLAALLAKGSSTGREAVVRAGVAAGIMLVPQLGTGVNVLMSSPDHVGTTVPVLVVWLILDRARPRWYIPVVAGVLLAWAEVADPLVLYIGALPLALVCAIRAYRAVAMEHQSLKSQWYDLALVAAAVLAVAAAAVAVHLIHTGGGFSVRPAPTQFVRSGALLSRNVAITGEGLLLLGGADVVGLRLTVSTVVTLLHLVGVFLAGWGTWLAARHFLRDRDRVAQVLVAAIVINLGAYLLSSKPYVITNTREIVAVLPFAAVLAGRLLAGRLIAAKMVPVLLVVLLCYLAGFGYEITRPQVPAQNQRLVSWLEHHHLRTGLSGYWQSNVVTLASGGRVQIRTVSAHAGRIGPDEYEAKASWYDPARSSANFVVLFPGIPGYPGFTVATAVLNTFGPSARSYRVGRYTVLVWHKNLLRDLQP
jgi:hypothetical protein